MQKFSITVLFNSDETFKAVEFGGKQYSIEEWNKQFTKLDPKDTEVGTNISSDGTIKTKRDG